MKVLSSLLVWHRSVTCYCSYFRSNDRHFRQPTSILWYFPSSVGDVYASLISIFNHFLVYVSNLLVTGSICLEWTSFNFVFHHIIITLSMWLNVHCRSNNSVSFQLIFNVNVTNMLLVCMMVGLCKCCTTFNMYFSVGIVMLGSLCYYGYNQ